MKNLESFVVRMIKNRAVRIIAYPVANLRNLFLQREYLKSEDSKYIRSLRNKYIGKRCFIIGSGPSLRAEDLDKLSNEITFASNGIYYIFSRTIWRPSFYMCLDMGFIAKYIKEIKASGSYLKFIRYGARRYGRKTQDSICYLNLNPHMFADGYKCPPMLSEDVSYYVSRLGTVTANAIEMAIYMGFTSIYLLGVDNDYTIKKNTDGKIYKDATVKSSYFKGMPDRDVNIQPVDYANNSYKLCKVFAQNKGVKIYNATRGGKLDIFERVKFEDLWDNETG